MSLRDVFKVFDKSVHVMVCDAQSSQPLSVFVCVCVCVCV